MNKRTTPKLPIPQTAVRMLAFLRRFFRTAPTEQQQRLWDVLTALRGPDEDKLRETKDATTAVIRSRLLPPLPEVMAMVERDNAQSVKKRREMPPSHFATHAMIGFAALGLDWEQNNDRMRKRKAKKA